MAVAEKKAQETSTSSLMDRVPVVSLVGVVYVIGCLGIVFKLVPELWRLIWSGISSNASSFLSMTFLTLFMLGTIVGLCILGSRLLGPKQQPGVKAGIFWGLLFVLGVLLMTRWVSLWVEHWIYYDRWFVAAGPTVGIILTLIALAGFIFLAVRWFMKPGFERMLVRFESAGWFSATSYKPQQGQKVRRGTVVGLLLLFGSGIWTMWSHKILERGPENWELGIPFTGKIVHIDPNDARDELTKEFPNWETEGVPPFKFRDIIDHYNSAKFVRIDTPTDIRVTYTKTVDGVDEQVSRTFTHNQPISKSEIAEIKSKLVASDADKLLNAEEAKPKGVPAVVVPAAPPTGPMELDTLRLLPHIRFTLPFLLLAATLWFSWRVVNLPSFADFLIATEAELNKVSWTSRKRLYQDTIVVLTTLILMAALLFAMDQIWLHLLSWKRVGVIYQDDTPAQTTKGEKPLW